MCSNSVLRPIINTKCPPESVRKMDLFFDFECKLYLVNGKFNGFIEEIGEDFFTIKTYSPNYYTNGQIHKVTIEERNGVQLCKMENIGGLNPMFNPFNKV